MLWKQTVRVRQILKDFVAEQFGLSKRKAKDLIDTRQVFVNRRRVWIATHQLAVGDLVEVPETVLSGSEEENTPRRSDKNLYQILYQDQVLLAVNKGPGIETNDSADSLQEHLKAALNLEYLEAIHRLDQDTSGVILFAKTPEFREQMIFQWKAREIQKLYLAMVIGRPKSRTITVKQDLEGKEAVTHVQVLSHNDWASLVLLDIETGRKHQIRKHLASIRLPILGDRQYGLKEIDTTIVKAIPRQMLHAHSIGFIHPLLEQEMKIIAPVWPDFSDWANKIGLSMPINIDKRTEPE